MRAAVARVDAVREAHDGLGEAVVVLQGDLDRGVLDDPRDVQRLVEDGVPRGVQVPDEAGDAAVEIEGDLAVGAFVDQLDFKAGVEISHLAQAGRQRGEVILVLAEDLRVGLERDRGAAGPHGQHVGHRPGGAAPRVLLEHVPTVALHLDAHLGGQGVHHVRAHPVQSAGDLVAAAAELGPGVERRHRRLEAGQAGGGVDVDGNAPPVVLDGDRRVLRDLDDDPVAVARHRLVDGVVDDLVDQVMEAALVGAPDVHSGPAAYRLRALEHLDVYGGVVLRRGAVLCLHGHEV